MPAEVMQKNEVVIVDYGMGNFGSVRNMLSKLGVSSVYTSKSEVIINASRIILPGVGHFAKGMENIDKTSGLREALALAAGEKRIPILGICLGAQLLTRHSEEGDVAGLDLLPADTVRFQLSSGFKVPHMGWQQLHLKREHPVFAFVPPDPRFYFVHSFHMRPHCEGITIAESVYENSFSAAIGQGNIIACQFHPEKSHKFGLSLLRGFINWRLEK